MGRLLAVMAIMMLSMSAHAGVIGLARSEAIKQPQAL